MAEAETSGEPPRAVLARLAFERGRELGAAARAAGRRPGRPRCASSRQHGFEPRAEDGAVTLANCPFHALAREHTELVCGMNLRLLDGVLGGRPRAGLDRRGCSRRRAAAACGWSRDRTRRGVDTRSARGLYF